MLPKIIIALCFVTLAIPVQSVHKCYVCEYFDHEGVGDEKCKDEPAADEFLKKCDETVENGTQPIDWQCVKVTGRIEVEEENFNLVKRFCSPGRAMENECKDTQSYHTEHGMIKRGKHCVCDEEKCNGATSNAAVGIVILSVGVIIASLAPKM